MTLNLLKLLYLALSGLLPALIGLRPGTRIIRKLQKKLKMINSFIVLLPCSSNL